MEGKPSERVKLYLAGFLACVLVAIVYGRFIHKGPGAAPSSGQTGDPAAGAPEVSEVPDLGAGPRAGGAIRPGPGGNPGPMRDPVRDIFAPGDLPVAGPGQAEPAGELASLSSLELRGVVMGGGSPVALINDRFVRTGDRIGPFRVVRIGQKEVLLDSGIETRTLRLMKEE